MLRVQVNPAIRRRTRYALPGTGRRHGAIRLRPCCALPSTDLRMGLCAYELATGCPALTYSFAMRCPVLTYAVPVLIRCCYEMSSTGLRSCHGMSGTDVQRIGAELGDAGGAADLAEARRDSDGGQRCSIFCADAAVNGVTFGCEKGSGFDADAAAVYGVKSLFIISKMVQRLFARHSWFLCATLMVPPLPFMVRMLTFAGCDFMDRLRNRQGGSAPDPAQNAARARYNPLTNPRP